MITAGTYRKERFFCDAERLLFLQQTLLETFASKSWEVQAWAVFSNHYHCIVRAPDNADALTNIVRTIHAKTALFINKQDAVRDRKIWHEYWDTCLTFERSYLARLAYVINNPVKHGLVSDPEQYAYCSAAWFALHAPSVFQKQIKSFKCDTVKVHDDYDL